MIVKGRGTENCPAHLRTSRSAVGGMGRVRHAWADLWDRFAASDPGLIRLLSASTTVGAIVLALGVLALLDMPVLLMVAGALTAMVSTFAINEPQPRDQAVTLALALPAALVSVTLAGGLLPFRFVSDLVFVVVIFLAVYVRRFGKRGTSLGWIAFQVYFVTLFLRIDTGTLPRFYAVLAIALAASAVVRFGIVRVTPERTLRRLRGAFRARLARVVDALADVVEAEAAGRATEQQIVGLHRHTARLHECALMIQNRLEAGTEDARTAALVQRRVAEAELAAERLGIHLLRALHQDTGDHTLTLHLPGHRPAPGARPVSERPDAAVLRRLASELRALRVLVSRIDAKWPGTGLAAVRNRLLGYRDDARLPDAVPGLQDAFRGVADVARAILGLQLALEEDDDSSDDSPETARSREEIGAEDVSLASEDDEGEDERTGLDRPSTRAAFQVAVGSALAILGGELISPQRWYWAVLTCWVVFINTASTGEILVKGSRRLVGTVVGVAAGLGLAGLVGGRPWLAFFLAVLCVFAMFFTAPVSHTLMAFFVTTMIGLLYTLLHTFSPEVLVLRIEETALGAVCGIAAAVLVLPVRTRHRTDEQLLEVLRRLRAMLTQAIAQLSGDPAADLMDKARELDTALDDLRASVKPLMHPVSPLRTRRRNARYIMGLLETCAYHARSLAATAELVPDSLRIGADPQLRQAARRIDANLQALIDQVGTRAGEHHPLESGPNIAALLSAATEVERAGTGGPGRSDEDKVTLRVLRHLQRLDEGVLGLARPLGAATSESGEPRPVERGGPLADSAR